jgi:hypothetical protein
MAATRARLAIASKTKSRGLDGRVTGGSFAQGLLLVVSVLQQPDLTAQR